MYIFQHSFLVLCKRIDRIRGKRNGETGVEAVVGEK
jgi:hypothetical protein